jgi:hypothetical protein
LLLCTYIEQFFFLLKKSAYYRIFSDEDYLHNIFNHEIYIQHFFLLVFFSSAFLLLNIGFGCGFQVDHVKAFKLRSGYRDSQFLALQQLNCFYYFLDFII